MIACLGMLPLSGCPADLTSVGSWKPSAMDAAAEPSEDAATEAGLDAATEAGTDAGADAAPLQPAGPYIEAELGERSGGFEVQADPTASAGEFLAPPTGPQTDMAPGDARSRYLLDVPVAGDYVLWGRIHGQDADRNRLWFQVDGGTWYLWRMSTGDVWFWDDLHDDMSYDSPVVFPLEAGIHELVLANSTEGVRLDRLYFTADGDEPPGNDTFCDPPHTIQVGDSCLLSCGIQAPETTCVDSICAGRPLLEAYDCDMCCEI